MVKMKVPMTIIAPFYYGALIVTLIALALYLMNYEIPNGMTVIIVLTAVTMVLAFIDYTKSYYIAKETLRKEKEAADKATSQP